MVTITGITQPKAALLLLLEASLALGAVPTPDRTADPFIDVRSFGAVGDGRTDDTESLQKALDYAANLSAGMAPKGAPLRPEVFFPAGIYLIHATLKITSPMQLVGTSADIYGGSSIWRVPSAEASNDVLMLTESAAGSAIEQLAIRISGTPVPGSAGIHVNFPRSLNGTGMSPLRLESVAVSNTYDGIWIEAANNVFMSNLQLVNFLHDGLRVQKTLGFYLNNSMIAGAANADVELTTAAGVQINNVETYHGRHGFLIEDSTQFFFQGVIADSTTADGFAISNSVDLHFVNSWAAGSTQGHGVSLDKVNNFGWSGGFIRGNYQSGLMVDSGCQNVSIDDVRFSANGFKNRSNRDTYGIYINRATTHLRVVNSSFGDLGEDAGNTVQTYAIYVNRGNAANVTNAVIQGNQDQHDTFTNANADPWVLAGNQSAVSWITGDAAPSGSCSNGSLYTSVVADSGGAYVCVNKSWHKLSYK